MRDAADFAAMLEQARALKAALAQGRCLGEVMTPVAGALPMLFVALGIGGDVRSVHDALPLAPHSLELAEAMGVLGNMGFAAFEETLAAASIDPRLLPCLFVRGGEVLVILESTGTGAHAGLRRGARYHPAARRVVAGGRGPRCSSARRTRWEKQLNETTRRASGTGWYRLMLQRFRGLGLQVIGVGMMANLISLSVPLLIMLSMTASSAAHATEDLTYLAMGFGLAIVVEMCLRHLRARQVGWLAARMDLLISTAIISHLLRLPAGADRGAPRSPRSSRASRASRRSAISSPARFSSP